MILLAAELAERAAYELLSNVMTKGQKKLFIEAGVLDRRGRPPKGMTLRESLAKAKLRDLRRSHQLVQAAAGLIDPDYRSFETKEAAALKMLLLGLAQDPPALAADWNDCRAAALRFAQLGKQNVNELIRAVVFDALGRQFDETVGSGERLGFDAAVTALLMMPAARTAAQKLSMQLAADALPVDLEALSNLWTRLVAGAPEPESAERATEPAMGLAVLDPDGPSARRARRLCAAMSARALEKLLRTMKSSSALRSILEQRLESTQDPNFRMVFSSLTTPQPVPTQLQLELLPKLYTLIYEDVLDAGRYRTAWLELQRALHQASARLPAEGNLREDVRSALAGLVRGAGVSAWLLACCGWLARTFEHDFALLGRELVPLRLADTAEFDVDVRILDDDAVFGDIHAKLDAGDRPASPDACFGAVDGPWPKLIGDFYAQGLGTAVPPAVAKALEDARKRRGEIPASAGARLRQALEAAAGRAQAPGAEGAASAESDRMPEAPIGAVRQTSPKKSAQEPGRTKLSEALAATASGKEPQRGAWPEFLTAGTVHVEGDDIPRPEPIRAQDVLGAGGPEAEPAEPSTTDASEASSDAGASAAADADAPAPQNRAADDAESESNGAAPLDVFPVEDDVRAPALQAPPRGRRLLGVIRIWEKFINFYPVAEWLQGAFKLRSSDAMRREFPLHGAVSLRGWTRGRPVNGELFVAEILPGEITRSDSADYASMIDVSELLREKRLRHASDYGVYPVVRCAPGALEESRAPLVTDAVWPERGTVLVEDPARRGCCFGPYPIRENAQKKPYVQCPAKDPALGSAVLRAWRAEHEQDVVSTMVFSGVDAQNLPVFEPVAFASTHGMPRVAVDLATDAALFAQIAEYLEPGAGVDAAALAEMDLLTADEAVHRARSARILAKIARSDGLRDVMSSMAPVVSRIVVDAFRMTAGEKPSTPLSADEAASIVDAALASDQVISRLESHQKAAAEMTRLQGEIDAMKAEREALQTSIEALRGASENLEKEAADAAKTIEAARRALRVEDVLRPVAELRREMSESIAELARERAKASEAFRAEADAVGEHLRAQVKAVRDVAFEGAVAAKFAEAAAAWTARSEREDFERLCDQKARLPKLDLTGRRLVEHLVRELGSRRPYAREDVINFYLTVTQHFLTIFSGAPGSGKTSGCTLIADALGLVEADRFLPVSVERGWTSKRDFIGYWNPLTKRFESADPLRYEAFRMLDIEAGRDAGGIGEIVDAPYFMLLDEANLSPMEYYWADFMNVADERGRLAFLSLGGDARCRIPEHLRFLATINNDFTTEALSPRLLDRAAIVTLPETPIADDAPAEPAGLVRWSALVETFGARRADARIAERVAELEAAASRLGVAPSIRTRKSILGYAAAGEPLFGSLDAALDFAALQRLLPRANASGDDAREALEAFVATANAKGWRRSAAAAADMLARGDEALGCYRFF